MYHDDENDEGVYNSEYEIGLDYDEDEDRNNGKDYSQTQVECRNDSDDHATELQQGVSEYEARAVVNGDDGGSDPVVGETGETINYADPEPELEIGAVLKLGNEVCSQSLPTNASNGELKPNQSGLGGQPERTYKNRTSQCCRSIFQRKSWRLDELRTKHAHNVQNW